MGNHYKPLEKSVLYLLWLLILGEDRILFSKIGMMKKMEDEE